MARTVLVIGAQGVLGTFLAREFTSAGWHVTRAGRRRENALDFRLIDLDDVADLRQACAKADLVVNTAHHRDLSPERTVLRHGGALINLTDFTPAQRAQLAGEGAEGRGLVVADTGFSGIAYLAIAEMLHEHREADAAEYTLMFSANGSSGRAGALFAHRLLTGSSHHETTTVPFPEPFGERRCIEVGAGRDGGLRKRIGAVPVRHYLCMQPRPLHSMLLALNRARLIGLMPTASFTAGTRKVPTELTEEAICEWFAISRGGRRLAGQTLAGQGYYRMTVAATVAFGEALLGSNAAEGRRGLRSIDELITLDDIRPAAEQRGIRIREQPEHSLMRAA
jgi:NAD(P)-dependent dehydrogenase (short-subunit alcohol dehydrogenase family)